MKTNNHTPELDELLASLEHAGRDARRREELGAMIDRLSEAESTKPARSVVLLWLPRLAAAACLLFFILTAVRIWLMPVDGGAAGPMVAQAEEPAVPALQPMPEEEPVPVQQRIVRRLRPAAAVDAKETDVAETIVVREVEQPVLEHPATIVEEPLLAEEIPAIVPEPEPIAPPEPPALAQTTPAPQEEAPLPRRTSFWRSLFSPVEPDEMNGTTLAIRIL